MQYTVERDMIHHGRTDRNRIRFAAGCAFLLLGMLAAAPGYAEEATEENHGEIETARHEAHDTRNKFMGFAGWSHKDSGKDSLTYGMEYSYRIAKRIAVGAFLEMSEGQFKADTVGISFGGYATERLFLFGAAGAERTLFAEKEYVLRVGLGYGFPVAGIELKPLAWVDFVGGHKITFLGIGVEKNF